MTADPASLRFFVDENSLGVGKALAIARRDVVHVGHPLMPEVPPGTQDSIWMPFVAQRGLVAIGRDKRIRTKPVELALLRDHGLRVFWIAGKQDLSSWGYLVRIVRRWDDIERITRDSCLMKTGPSFDGPVTRQAVLSGEWQHVSHPEPTRRRTSVPF